MTRKSFKAGNLLRYAACIAIIAAILLFNSSVSQAYENFSPSSISIITQSISEDNPQNGDIYIEVSNSSALSKETNSLIKSLQAKGVEYKGLTLQIQTRTDSTSWKTQKRDAEFIDPKSSMTTLQIFNAGELDLSKTTVYSRARYAWVTDGGTYYGAWSETAAIGVNASEVGPPESISSAPALTEETVGFTDDERPVYSFKIEDLPDSIKSIMTRPNGTLILNVMISENGNSLRNILFQPVSTIKYGETIECELYDSNGEYQGGNVLIQTRFEWYNNGVTYYGQSEPMVYSRWTGAYTACIDPWKKASSWALEELNKAHDANMIPAVLQGKDLTKTITRAEFTELALKTYETMTGKTVTLAKDTKSPFTDCDNENITKAYSIGLINGVGNDRFAPEDNLSREQAAVILTRIFKIMEFRNWTLETDSEFTLEYESPALFADDASISDWAKDSVYFMVSKGIINGIGNNKFAPKNTTQAEINKKYANATREQAILISVRMAESM